MSMELNFSVTGAFELVTHEVPDSVARRVRHKFCTCVRRHSPVPRQLHLHHIWPKGEGGPDTASNLIVMCPNAHANVHILIAAYKKAGTPDLTALNANSNPLVVTMARRGWRCIQAQKVVT